MFFFFFIDFIRVFTMYAMIVQYIYYNYSKSTITYNTLESKLIIYWHHLRNR